jgi:hypothetical protein
MRGQRFAQIEGEVGRHFEVFVGIGTATIDKGQLSTPSQMCNSSVEFSVDFIDLGGSALGRLNLLKEFVGALAVEERAAQRSVDATFAVEQIDQRNDQQSNEHAGKAPSPACGHAVLDTNR